MKLFEEQITLVHQQKHTQHLRNLFTQTPSESSEKLSLMIHHPSSRRTENNNNHKFQFKMDSRTYTVCIALRSLAFRVSAGCFMLSQLSDRRQKGRKSDKQIFTSGEKLSSDEIGFHFIGFLAAISSVSMKRLV